jgi:hypothetical protein
MVKFFFCQKKEIRSDSNQLSKLLQEVPTAQLFVIDNQKRKLDAQI